MTKRKEPGEKRGRYRKVEVRIWGDEKFCSLTPIAPCAQGLFVYLITGPHTSPIPGLFCAGRAAMSEALGWQAEAFDKAFGEVFREGLAVADWKARVVWIPKAIRHNKPESPNVITSWGSEFDLIPDCDLKWAARKELEASIYALGEAYGKAFDKAFSKPSGNPTRKTTGNQEQEQEQKQDINTPQPPKGGRRVKTPVEDPDGFAEFYAEYRRKDARADAVKAWRALAPDAELQARMMAAVRGWRWADDPTKIPLPASWIRGARWEDQGLGTGPAQATGKPDWVTAAGFSCIEEASNFRCNAANFHEFADGKRITEATAA